MPCSPLTAPPRDNRGREDLPQQAGALRRVGLEHGQVDVAVAGVAGAQDQPAPAAGDLSHLGQEPGHGRARHDRVHDVVGPGALGSPERPLPRLDQAAGGRGGGPGPGGPRDRVIGGVGPIPGRPLTCSPPAGTPSPDASTASTPSTCWRVTPYLTARIPPAFVAMVPPRLALISPGKTG